MRVVVPMSAHSNLHKGHLALLDYAKSFGEVYVVVYLEPLAVQYYIQTGKRSSTQHVNVHSMKKELDDLGIKSHYVSLSHTLQISEDERVRLYDISTQIANLYKERLLTPLLYGRAAIAIAKRIMTTRTTTPRSNVIEVRGPDIIHFVLREMCKRRNSPVQIEIFPHVAINEKTGINYSSHAEKYLWLPDVGPAIGNARDHFKVGRNEELVKELNNAYQSVPWEWQEILVWEDELVNGRLELVQISIKENEGMAIVEAQQYEAN